MEAYIETVLIFIIIFGLAAMSYDLLLGYGGMISMAQISFVGIGAYCTAVFTTKMGWGFFPSLFVGILMAATVGLVIGATVMRLAGDYLFAASVGFVFAIEAVLIGWDGVTGGTVGISHVPNVTLFGITVSSFRGNLLLYGIIAAICYFLSARLVKSPFGRYLKATRDDEVATLSVGKNVVAIKLCVFAISAGMAAVPGSLYAHFVTYVDPYHYRMQDTFFMFCSLILGGMGTLKGAYLGTLILTGIPEVTRFMGLPVTIMGQVQEIIFGGALVIVAFFRPQGLLGKRKPKPD